LAEKSDKAICAVNTRISSLSFKQQIPTRLWFLQTWSTWTSQIFFSAGLRNDNGIRADAYRSVPRSTSTTMQRASTIGSQGSVGVQAMVQSDQLCGEVEASQVSSAHQAATRRCSNERDQQAEAVILAGCGDFVRDTNQCRGALLFWDIRARVNSPPTPEYVSVRGGRPVEGLSMRQVTTHNVNSQPKFSRSASRLALIRQVYVGRIGTHKG
jgi:hypothetical protein